MRVKFFAWLKEDLQEELEIKVDSISIEDLKNKLIQELGIKFEVLKEPSILVSVNLEFADETTIVNNSDEVAFFPPVTGG